MRRQQMIDAESTPIKVLTTRLPASKFRLKFQAAPAVEKLPPNSQHQILSPTGSSVKEAA